MSESACPKTSGILDRCLSLSSAVPAALHPGYSVRHTAGSSQPTASTPTQSFRPARTAPTGVWPQQAEAHIPTPESAGPLSGRHTGRSV